MEVDFIPVNFKNERDCEVLAKWFNDQEINYLISPNFSYGPLSYMSPKYIQQMNLHTQYPKHAFFIVVDGYIIGDINIIENPDFLLKKQLPSCWLGITIGEKPYRGIGVGKIAMNFIEQYAKNLGFPRMELGVFEFNQKAISFYKKLGYKEIGVIPRFTNYQGKWYDDIRFEKRL